MAKRKTTDSKEVQINEVRTSIRKEIEKRYGSVAKFLHDKDSEQFGGRKIRCYLYDSGPISFDTLSALSKWLGIGQLTRDLIVTRSYKYLLSKSEEV